MAMLTPLIFYIVLMLNKLHLSLTLKSALCDSQEHIIQALFPISLHSQIYYFQTKHNNNLSGNIFTDFAGGQFF